MAGCASSSVLGTNSKPHDLRSARTLLFNADDSKLDASQQEIIELFGGLRSMLDFVLEAKGQSMSRMQSDKLSHLLSQAKQEPDAITQPFIDKTTNVLCELVRSFG